MPRYCLYLHDGPTTPPVSHYIEVADDDDAADIARVTLLATQGYTHVEVWKEDKLLRSQQRDSYLPDT